MAPSHLKQLKAALQERRNNGTKSKPSGQSTKPQPRQAGQQPAKKRPKSEGEAIRRRTLLPELQQRHRVGGIVDRRIGENDPTLAPEERALQRYTRQRSKRDSMFNLEDSDNEDHLTHMGQSILASDVANVRDDFDANGLEDDDQEAVGDLFTKSTNKRRLSETLDETMERAQQDDEPNRKKSKREVMEEVIAKSKLYKYERQHAKEEDEVLREELDKGLPDLMAMLRGVPVIPLPPSKEVPPPSQIHPDRAALMDDDGKRQLAEKNYDKNLRQMAQDKRAQPTTRTLTEEEIAVKEARRLKELEEKRQRRMRGEAESSESESEQDLTAEGGDVEDESADEAAEFGLTERARSKLEDFDVEDEDQFVIDEDLVASGSDVDEDFSEEEDESAVEEMPDDDDEFLQDVFDENEASEATKGSKSSTADGTKGSSQLAFTYPCPRNHAELLDVLKGTSASDLPTIIQRIRALYHPQLLAENKEKLSDFSRALVEHVPYMSRQETPLPVVESVVRHLHSLSRMFPTAIAGAFRAQLSGMSARQTLDAGDLFILTAVGSIYPTSDHFHQVVTPAITVMARWLSMATPSTVQISATGAYVVALCVKYQSISKRYIPEAVRFTVAAIKRNLDSATTEPHVQNLTSMMDLWASSPSFTEIFSPVALQALTSLPHPRARQKLLIMLSQSRLLRRPLELHHHRPLAIKSSIPKFEEGFNPDKHYDVDRERAEAAKLRKEYKREKKGALRELKKDASFLAREKLKQKKEADRAYETKQRRLIAEIQGEEGREKNNYEREKRMRKGRR